MLACNLLAFVVEYYFVLWLIDIVKCIIISSDTSNVTIVWLLCLLVFCVPPDVLMPTGLCVNSDKNLFTELIFIYFLFVPCRFNELVIVNRLTIINAVTYKHHGFTDPLIAHSRDALPTPGITTHGTSRRYAPSVTDAVTYEYHRAIHARRHQTCDNNSSARDTTLCDEYEHVAITDPRSKFNERTSNAIITGWTARDINK